MRPTVRFATEQDLPIILDMAEKFYATTKYQSMVSFCKESTKATAVGLMTSGFVLIAEIEGKPAGMIAMFISPFLLNFSVNNATEVMWWVEPDARSSRAAMSLIHASIAECEKRGCRWKTMALLETSPAKAADFYMRLGFEPVESSYLLEL